jgi:hypothetical protein
VAFQHAREHYRSYAAASKTGDRLHKTLNDRL